MPSAELQAEAAARKLRRELNLGVRPIRDLVSLIEQHTGCEVAILQVANNEHGMTLRDPASGKQVIGVATQSPLRKRSTLAHELAHVLFRDVCTSDNYDERTPGEIRADAFARHLLVPKDGVRQLLGEQETTTESLSKVVQHFLVSPPMACIAMRDAGYPIQQEWRNYTTQHLAVHFGWIDYYRSLEAEAAVPHTPQRLLRRAIAGYEAGVVSLQTLATLRGLPAGQVLEELEQEGIFPAQLTPTDLAATSLPEVNVDLSLLDDEETDG